MTTPADVEDAKQTAEILAIVQFIFSNSVSLLLFLGFAKVFNWFIHNDRQNLFPTRVSLAFSLCFSSSLMS
jgi:hypothetical protein